MASQLPAFPRFVFTVFEPISLLLGYFPAVLNPDWFIAEQVQQAGAIIPSTTNSRLVAQQLGNCYGLAFLVAIAVLYTTTEIRVVRSYLVALWVADIGHVALTYFAIGPERFVDIASWNGMAWGNIGATTFLFLTRTAYLLGLFGQNLPAAQVEKQKKLQ